MPRVLDLTTFAEALRGADGPLRQEAGPDAVIDIATELSSVFLVRPEEGGQTGTLARVGAHGGGSVSLVRLPRSFRVREIRHDDEQFFLTDVAGRTAHGTPAQWNAWPKLLDEEVNPRFDEQLDAIVLDRHLFPVRGVAGLDAPKTDQALSGPEVDEIARIGEAWVAFGEKQVYLTFDNAWPEKVTELLPHTRDLLASFDQLGRAGAEFLWSAPEPDDEDEDDDEELDEDELDEDDEDEDDEDEPDEDDEDEDDEAQFLALATPTSLVVYLTGDFEIHFEGLNDTEFYLDGYWPAVQFRADGTPVGHTIEA